MLPTCERPTSPRLVVTALGTLCRHLPPVDGRGPVTDYTRPLLLGYARRDLYLSDQHIRRVKQEFAAMAKVEGYTMGSVYIEDPDTAPAAFDALVESVNRYDITAVLLPEWRHLALVGDPAAMKQKFERATGARFMLYDAP